MKLLLILTVTLATLSTSNVDAKGVNCGIKCFRWDKCMKQLSGHENRPGQLGNTGIIVLNTCDQGECDCAEILGSQKETRTATATEAKSKKTSKSGAGATATTTTTTPKPSLAGLRRPPRLVRQRPVTSVVKTEVSVSSSSSSTKTESSTSAEESSKSTRARLTSPRSRFFRKRV